MTTPTRPQPPTGLRRTLFRLPIHLYRARLGWLLGQRFLMLDHVGRSTGAPRRTVLEVVAHDPERDTYTVASGFGPGADWYRNVRKQPQVSIRVGTRLLAVTAVPLTPAESAAAMVDYAHRHPTAARRLSRFMGFEIDGGDDAYRRVGQAVPFVRFEPRR